MSEKKPFFQNTTAIVLAGGKSSRMGTDKSRLPFNGLPMIEYVLTQLRPLFDKIIISSNRLDFSSEIKEEIVPDEIPGKGPVMGLITALKKSKTNINFVQACDIPAVKISLINQMLDCLGDFDAIMPRNPLGQVEPLFAVYKKSALCAMAHVLEQENGKAGRIAAHCRTGYVDIEISDDLKNINTMEDYHKLISAKP